jgi:predicted nucleic acid-binding protein
LNFLLDTNVVSEWTKPRPDPGVAAWLASVDEAHVFLSVVTLAELRHGIERMAAGMRRHRLDIWLADDITARFEDRLLLIDAETAHAWGRIMATGRAMGRPLTSMDAFLAATARRHDMTFVTRNVSDFDAVGLSLLNPWSGS